MVDASTGRFIAGATMSLARIDDERVRHYMLHYGKSSASLDPASTMSSMIHAMADANNKYIVTMYKKYWPDHQITTFEEAVSLYLQDSSFEFYSRYEPFEYTGTDRPLYLYPRHAMIRGPWSASLLDPPVTHLKFLGTATPVSVNWPPTLHCLPLCECELFTTSPTTIGPLTRYVCIFLLSV